MTTEPKHQEALDLHEAGALDEAAAGYEALLAQAPYDIEVRYLLAVLRWQRPRGWREWRCAWVLVLGLQESVCGGNGVRASGVVWMRASATARRAAERGEVP